MLDVVGFGENSVDFVYRVPVLPGGGSAKIRVGSPEMLPGGQVATTMAGCAALGLRAGYIGTFGSDEAGRSLRAELERRGVDLRHASVRSAPNRHAVILVDPDGERVVLWSRDGRLAVQPADVRAEWIAGARLVHVDAIDEEASIALARLGRAAGLPVTSDIEQATERTPDLIAAVTVPIFAETVPATLTGEPDPELALHKLAAMHAGPLVVTLGARGALLLEGGRVYHEPAGAVTAVDTTGAGDVFRAGFIDGMLRGLHGPALLRFANAAAAVSCSRAGAMSSVPSPGEVALLLQQQEAERRHNQRD